MFIHESIPLLNEISDKWKKEIGRDYPAYKNHVYRVVHFCLALHQCDEEEQEKVIIAGCFHDIGMWTHNSLDYFQPSVELANSYLTKECKNSWLDEIDRMMNTRHYLSVFFDNGSSLVEAFHKADMVDYSLGLFRFGLSKAQVRIVKSNYPDSGFHKRLLQLTISQFKRDSLKSRPIMKW